MDTPLKRAPNDRVVKAALLIFDLEERVLFARSRGQTKAYTIGGKKEPGETIEQALIREFREETGGEIIPETVRFFHLFEGPCHGYVPQTVLEMHCFTADYRGTLAPRSEIEELVWLSPKDIGTGRTTEMGDTILDFIGYQQSGR